MALGLYEIQSKCSTRMQMALLGLYEIHSKCSTRMEMAL